MDLNQAGTATPGRTQSFSDGVQGTPGMVATGLAQESAMFNSRVPGKFTPHSVLQEIPGMSGNGMSQADRQRVLPGGYTMPSANGSSEQSYQAASMMRLMSRDSGA